MRTFILSMLVLGFVSVALAQPVTPPTPPNTPRPIDNFPPKLPGAACKAMAYAQGQLDSIRARLRATKPDQDIYQIGNSTMVQFGTHIFYNVDGTINRTEPKVVPIGPGDYIEYVDDDSIRIRSKADFEAKCDVTP